MTEIFFRDEMYKIKKRGEGKREEAEALLSDITERKMKLFRSQISFEAKEKELDIFYMEEKKAWKNLGESFLIFSEKLAACLFSAASTEKTVK